MLVEAGVWALPFFGAGWWLRGGYSFRLVDTRKRARTGSTLDLPLLLGVQANVSGCCGISDHGYGLDATVGLDWTYWVSPHFGLGLRLTGGAMASRSQTHDYTGQVSDFELVVWPIARLALGLHF